MERDVPEPAVLGDGLEHHRRALVAAGVAIGALPVGPNRAFVQHRVPEPQLEPVLQHRRLAARIDDHLGPHVATPVLVVNADAARAIPLEEDFDDMDTVEGVDAMFARVVEHHLVELAAHHLPGLRARVRLVVPEVERRRQLAVRVDELHAVLLDEVAALHLRQHVEPLEHPVGLGDERLADMESRKLLALEKADLEAVLRQERRRGRPRRTAANDNNIVAG